MEFTKLTIKNFIADLPRIFNENFNIIKKKFDELFPDNSKSIKLDGAEVEKIRCNTIRANNVFVTDSSGNVRPLKDYIDECIKNYKH